MSVKKNDLVQFIGGLQTLTDEVPEIMSKIAVGEGVYAVKQARLICTNDSPDIVNTGDYRRNWKSDQTAKRAGRRFIVRFYNPLDYAGHLEHGFRSHFVPVTGKATRSSITGTTRKAECSSARRADMCAAVIP